MSNLQFKTRIAPEHRRDHEDTAVRQKTFDKKCPVQLFQVSRQRNMGKQSSIQSNVKIPCNGSGDSSSTGIHKCPTNLFLSKSFKKDGDFDLLFRRKEVDENFKLLFQTKELNRLSKNSRIEWLIEAVGGSQTQEAVNSDLIACSNKGQGCFHGIARRFNNAITSIRKLLRRGRVDVLPQKDA